MNEPNYNDMNKANFDFPTGSMIDINPPEQLFMKNENKNSEPMKNPYSPEDFEEQYKSGEIQLDSNYFYSLDFENKKCIDCQNIMPTFCSINNGVFLCQNCAKKS